MSNNPSPVEEPSTKLHIFVYQEGGDLVAYNWGKEIARRDTFGVERFYSDLHVWMRKNGVRRIWRIDKDEKIQPAPDVEARVNELMRERD